MEAQDWSKDPRVQEIIKELGAWPGEVLASHKSANQAFHKLSFLADLGLGMKDKGIAEIAAKALSKRDEEGIPLLPMKISAAHGGNGEETWAWALCDAPTTLSALLRLGYPQKELMGAVDALAARFNKELRHWGCEVSKTLSWRGPGKKSDPCPYATLIMIKLLVSAGKPAYAPLIKAGAACLLELWQNSRQRHPYIFYMGTDFRKLKLPFVWYDILHLADVLSSIPAAVYPELRADPRFQEIVSRIADKEVSGGFIPESVYQALKAWDFGQKKEASALMGYFARRVITRAAL